MKSKSNKTLLILTGPTAVGKTDLSIELALNLKTPIISVDARQFYKELNIGVASPAKEQLDTVKHHFIGHLSITDYYNVYKYEQQAIALLNDIFKSSDIALATGGSGLYIDALCYGIDELPDINTQIRKEAITFYKENGIEGLRLKLKTIDPEFYKQVDIANPNRMMRAIEVFLQTGQKFSTLRKNKSKERSFSSQIIILERERQNLFHRINERVDIMVEQGLIEEALSLKQYRNENALNTVGYKELYQWLDNKYNLHEAIEKIKTNSRRYAKRQITWFNKYNNALRIHPEDKKTIMDVFIK